MINKSDYSIFKDATAWLPGVPHWRVMGLGTKELINKLKYVHLFFYVYSSCDNWKMLLVFKRSSICFTCEKVICTFPSCSTAYEVNDLALPVYFCKKLQKGWEAFLFRCGKKLCSIFIVEQKFNILNKLRGCNILCTCWVYQQIRSSC